MGGERSILHSIRKEHALAFGAFGLIVGVIGLYVGFTGSRFAAVARQPRPAPVTAAPTHSALPPAPEPKEADRIVLGTAAGREQLLADLGAAREVDGRRLVPNSGPAPALRFDVDPSAAGMQLTVVGRTGDGVPPQHLRVEVDEETVGEIRLDVAMSRARLLLAGGVIRPGPHVLTLRLLDRDRAQQPGTVLLESVQIEPLAPFAEVVLHEPSARPLATRGFGAAERSDGRVGLWSQGGEAQVRLPLLPRGGDYVLGLVAQAHPDLPTMPLPVEVAVNDQGVGPVRLGKRWEVHYCPVPLHALRSGDNVVTLHFGNSVQVSVGDPAKPASEQRAALIERISLRRLTPSIHVDVGHPDDREYLAAGFTPDPPWGAARRFVFSEGSRSRFRLPLRPQRGDYLLELTAFGFAPIAPVSAAVRVNGGPPVAELELGAEEQTHTLTVPGSKLRAGANTVELEYGATGQPRQFSDASADSRELAAGLVALKLRPAD